MDREWVRILAAVAVSMLLPRMVTALGSRRETVQEQPPETVLSAPAETTLPPVTLPPETEPEQTQPEQASTIPVLTDSGEVVLMELETYIRGVVLAEMPAYFETEALKAQAVVARTYALRRIATGDRHPGGAVCTESTCCQSYITDEDYLSHYGGTADLTKIAQAVEDTAGLVLTYNGSLIDATYFSCSGGRTEDAAAVWGTDVPYLQAVDSPGEENAGSYEKQVYFSKEVFARLLGLSLTGNPRSWLGAVTYTDGGGVDTMVIGGKSFTGKQLRSLLGLNSTAFTVTADSAGITVTTRGNGHRVGMSQYGADAMAAAGSGYEEILTYYYQGTKIDKMGELG